MFLPLLIIGDRQQTEIMGHDEIPFLEFIEHLQFLDLQSLGFIDAVVVAEDNMKTYIFSIVQTSVRLQPALSQRSLWFQSRGYLYIPTSGQPRIWKFLTIIWPNRSLGLYISQSKRKARLNLSLIKETMWSTLSASIQLSTHQAQNKVGRVVSILWSSMIFWNSYIEERSQLAIAQASPKVKKCSCSVCYQLEVQVVDGVSLSRSIKAFIFLECFIFLIFRLTTTSRSNSMNLNLFLSKP